MGALNWNKGCFWKFGLRIFRRYRSASFFEAHNFRKNGLPTNKDQFSGNLEIWEPGNLGSKKIQNIQILKIQIRSAQNVGTVWISRKKTFPAPFGAIPGIFLRGPEISKKLLIFLGGPLLLSTLGGAIGTKFVRSVPVPRVSKMVLARWCMLYSNGLCSRRHGPWPWNPAQGDFGWLD